MEKSVLASLFLIFTLTSCADWSDGAGVLYGTYSTMRGEYQGAALTYLQFLENPNKNTPWVQYNLGNVYQFLGESNAALSLWLSIDDTPSSELSFRLAFNKGYLFFQKGQYQEAFDSFKQALVLRPASLEAKQNLELTLAKIQALNNNPVVALPRSQEGSRNPSATPQETRAMLDYIRRLESEKWKNLKEKPESTDSSDW